MGGEFNDAINQTFESMAQMNIDLMRGSIPFRMGSHEHDNVFGNAHIFDGYFGYSTSIAKEPRFIFHGETLHEFYAKRSYYNQDGNLRLHDMCSIKELTNMQDLDQLENLLEEENFHTEELHIGLVDIEKGLKSEFVRKEQGAAFLYNLNWFKMYNSITQIKEINKELMVEGLTNDPMYESHNLLIEGSNYFLKTPPYRDFSYGNFLAIIEKAEFYYTSGVECQSPAELYYKINLRDNLIMKNGGETLIENILNYNQFLDADQLHDKKGQHLLGILYKVQQVRESLSNDVKHYTPKEFATLFTEALINISYGVGLPSPDDGEAIYKDLGYHNHGMDTNNPHDYYDEKGTFFKNSKHFHLDFERLRVLESYVNTNFTNHEKLNHMQNTLERCRSMLVHDFIKDVFYEELYTKNPEQEEREFEAYKIRFGI